MSITVSTSRLEAVLSACAASTDSRPALEYVQVSCGRLAGTDGHRMHVVDLDAAASRDVVVYLNAADLTAGLKLLRKEIKLAKYRRADVAFHLNNEGAWRLVSNEQHPETRQSFNFPIRAERVSYPEIDNVLEKKRAKAVFAELATAPLLACLNAAIRTKSMLVKFHVKGGQCQIIQQEFDLDGRRLDLTQEFVVDSHPDRDIMFAISAPKMADAVAACESSHCVLSFVDKLNAVYIVDRVEGFTAVVMPMRCQ